MQCREDEMQIDSNTITLQKWTTAHSHLCQAEQAMFFFLASFADGRQEFLASPDELLPLLGRCSRARFNYLASGLARRGLIAIQPQPSGSQRWVIKERVNWTPAPLTPGERFAIPISRARRKLSEADAEWRAFGMAQKRCERHGMPFAYADFADFLRRVGRRPEGKFRSSVPMYALMKKNDRGEYEWRQKATAHRPIAPRS
jgi:hypothetical protein